jgi:hypothetical protein
MPKFLVTLERDVTDRLRTFVEVEAPTQIAAEHFAIARVDDGLNWQYHREISAGMIHIASVESV